MRRSLRKDAAPGAWEALSGRVEAGEQPLDAARREALEESGLRVTLDPRPVRAYGTTRLGRDMVVIAYRGRAARGTPALSDEHDAWAWMSLRRFARACPFPALVAAARAAARRPQGKGESPRRRRRGSSTRRTS